MSHPSRLNSVIARAVDGSKFDLEWYHKNYLDHVYAVSDDSGNLDEHYRYTAFGEVTIYNGSGTIKASTQINNQIMWNTRRLDVVTGYYLYKYRHYDPQLGRWPSRDPIEEDGGVNLYTFVGNSPINNWDKLGLAPNRWDIQRGTRNARRQLERVRACYRNKPPECCADLYNEYLSIMAQLIRDNAAFYDDQWYLTDRERAAFEDVYGLPTLVDGAAISAAQIAEQAAAAREASDAVSESFTNEYSSGIENAATLN
jgi:RHS repeat-associated protein